MPRGQDPEGFAELRAIFERAVDLEGEEQRRFLGEACGDDSELRRAVEELIGADRRSGRFLDEPLELDDLSTMDGDAGTDPPSADGGDADGISGDSLIGPYRLLRRLGRGGMGEVFLAVRADDAFRRRVVVKLVRRDRDDEDILRRSRAERQILAGLDHPHIARLYDGGTTEDRRPYFVMEYIEGVEIDDFCDQNRLSIDERLTLLRKVCAAVHYAHQNLVVHRDLKPSNILVTSDGEPKLLDFGIAKLLNPELGGDDLQQTATWLRLMTPQYASPEQVRGKHVTVTSDVYSLGVLLYKLLSGRLPYSFGGCSPREIERLLTETEPPKPSAVVVSDPAPPRALETAIQDTAPALASAEVARFRGVGPKELRRLLKGDLDSITAKALRASPQRRYASAEQLAEDLRRFQEGRPVAARAGTLRYRAGKLLRRRRGTIAASALLVAMLGGTLWSQSEQAEALAAERDQKQMVLSLLIEALRVADPYVHAGGDQLTIAEALERSRELLHQRLLDQPVLRAEMLETTGEIQYNLGRWRAARQDLEEALALRRGLYGDNHPRVAKIRGLLGSVLAQLGEMDDARLQVDAAVAAARRGQRGDLVDALNHWVGVRCVAGVYDEAEPLAVEAFELVSQGEERDLRAQAMALSQLARIRSKGGDPGRAAELYRRGLRLLESLEGEDHPSLAPLHINLGSALRRADDLEGAEREFEKALAIQRASLGDDHPLSASTLNNLAGLRLRAGRTEEALELYRNARRVMAHQGGDDHPQVFYLDLQIETARLRQGDPVTVEGTVRELLPRWRAVLGADHPFLAKGRGLLISALKEQGRTREAEDMLLADLDARLGRDPAGDVDRILRLLETLYSEQGRPEAMEAVRARVAEARRAEG